MEHLPRTASFDAFYQNFCNTIVSECGYAPFTPSTTTAATLSANLSTTANYDLNSFSDLPRSFSEVVNNDILSYAICEPSPMSNLEDIQTNDNAHVVPNMEQGEEQREQGEQNGDQPPTQPPTQQPTQQSPTQQPTPQPTQQQRSGGGDDDGEETEDDAGGAEDDEEDSQDSGESEDSGEHEPEEEDEEDPAYAPPNRTSKSAKGKRTHGASSASAPKRRKATTARPSPSAQFQPLHHTPQQQQHQHHQAVSFAAPSVSPLSNGFQECKLLNGTTVHVPDDKMDMKWKPFCSYFTKQFRGVTSGDLENVKEVRRRYQLRKSSQKGRTQQRERREQLETQLASIVTYTSDSIITALAPVVSRHVPQARANQLISDLNVAIRELLNAGAVSFPGTSSTSDTPM